MNATQTFSSVYGPVSSWRYGRSLGIDPIGSISTCSFNCVYCQLGEIEQKTGDRAIYIPTQQILDELEGFAPWDVDVITLSGSGEPTLALNLREILQGIADRTHRPTLVLTNGTTLADPEVRNALAIADRVSIKLDAVSERRFQGVNRPIKGINLADIWAGIEQFCHDYPGEIGIQTMLLSPWDAQTKAEYMSAVRSLRVDEIQLNTPTRPKPINRQLDGRGNHHPQEFRPYPVQILPCLNPEVLQDLAREIAETTGIAVRCAPA
ncbi:radical SAM protein [Laspinema sp. A4]|uniref:radical SAM protein n=1 Tax=Laspinema sp. D2d TaxID=2953686 RepID=UPI0021BA802F|nr:radical SAM protein [Laspinema sp. D2d]MCT7982947.1 radical SAM protein [Laspinema sp. D2d]